MTANVTLSPRPRKFCVENESWPKKPSYCETPAPKVSWFRFCSWTFSVTSTLFFWPGTFSTFGLSGPPSISLKYPSWLIFLMLNLSASVLKTPFSSSRTSRRTTLSSVVVFPTNVMRLTKYCSPSFTFIVMSTIAGCFFAASSAAGSSIFEGSGMFRGFMSG